MTTYRGNHQEGEIEIIEEVTVFDNQFMTLFNDRVLFPSGKEGNYLRPNWKAPYGVMVVPITDDNKLILVKNFRHPTRKWGWELIKGFGEDYLTPAECANKELEEKSGYIAERLYALKDFPDQGIVTSLFIANDLIKTRVQKEEEEVISDIHAFTQEEAMSLMKNECCHDLATLFAISLFVNPALFETIKAL